MPLRSAGKFVRRRFSREEYLGLYLTVGMLFTLLLLGLFIVIAHSVEGNKSLVQFDESVHVRMRDFREASPPLRDSFVAITQMGWVGTMSFLAVSGAAVL